MVRDHELANEQANEQALTVPALSHDMDTARFLQGSLSDVPAKCVFYVLS
jgi:hypothetical protein